MRIREVAFDADGIPALFLKLFTVTIDPVPFPLVIFIGFLAPLLGIMFGFDAISGERSQGTLPRLLAQPIHRDELILGKYVGGLAVVALMLTALTAFVSGIGIFRLGLIPEPTEIVRLITWLIVAHHLCRLLAGSGHPDLGGGSPGGHFGDDRGRGLAGADPFQRFHIPGSGLSVRQS